MTGKVKLYIGLLVLGLVVIGGGVWFLVKSPPEINIPEGSPVIVLDIDRVMAGEFSCLYIYEDGSIIYIEEKGLRIRSPLHPPKRTWRTGQIPAEELNGLLVFIEDSGFKELDEYYQFPGKPGEGGGFTMGDMSCTVYIDYGDLHKKVTAFGYLTPDHGITYPDMPYPINEIYSKLKNIAGNQTEEIYHETIKD